MGAHPNACRNNERFITMMRWFIKLMHKWRRHAVLTRRIRAMTRRANRVKIGLASRSLGRKRCGKLNFGHNRTGCPRRGILSDKVGGRSCQTGNKPSARSKKHYAQDEPEGC